MELEQGMGHPGAVVVVCRLPAAFLHCFLNPVCPFKQTASWEWSLNYFYKEQNSVIAKALFGRRLAVNGPSGLCRKGLYNNFMI